jgi:hypothetical protein
MFRKPLFSVYLLLTAIMITISVPPGEACAQCFGTLMLEPGFYEFDYLVRIAVHFGSAEDIPADIICSRGRMPGEEVLEVPIWIYNLHEGVTTLEFGIESNDSITSFAPAAGVSVFHEAARADNGRFYYHLKIDTPALCGPALLGYAYIVPAESSDLTWINFCPNYYTGMMFATDTNYNRHYLVSPAHGGYVGGSFLYTCQEPICREPNLPVTELEAVAGYGLAVRLTWTAGEGNWTVIRARTDRYPTGYGDGRLVVEMPSTPGQQQYYYDTAAPQGAIVYYKAFSLTRDLVGEIDYDAFIECEATDTTFTHGIIATEESSWGAIKTMGKK